MARQNVTISIDSSVLANARKDKLAISRVCEQALIVASKRSYLLTSLMNKQLSDGVLLACIKQLQALDD